MHTNSQNNSGTTKPIQGEARNDVLRVIFADDSSIYREQESELLSGFPSVDLVGVAASGGELLCLAKRVQWDLALIDIAMPDMDGVEVLRRLLEFRADAIVVMLTAFERPQTLREALRAGAKGFLTKETPTDEIVSALHRVYRGKTAFDERPLQMLQDFYLQAGTGQVDLEFASRLEKLPKRLKRIASYLAKSYTNREISRATGLSDETVGSYVRDTIALLGVRRGAIAVKMRDLEIQDQQHSSH